MIADFFGIEDPSFRGGARASFGDGNDEVTVGGGPGGGPRVRLVGCGVDQRGTDSGANYFAGGTDERGGVRVVVKATDGDARGDLLVGSGSGPRAVLLAGRSIPQQGSPEVMTELELGVTGGSVFMG